jgi:hypothetical protein
MANERKLQPFRDESEYLHAIGEAVAIFNILEWNAVWVCEAIDPGSISRLAEKTAGAVATTLKKLVDGLSAGPEKTELLNAANTFSELVKVRNGLIHGRPCTDSTTQKPMLSDDEVWTVQRLNKAADDFSKCSLPLNNHAHMLLNANKVV